MAKFHAVLILSLEFMLEICLKYEKIRKTRYKTMITVIEGQYKFRKHIHVEKFHIVLVDALEFIL